MAQGNRWEPRDVYAAARSQIVVAGIRQSPRFKPLAASLIPSITGVIIAAGASRRMGSPKALLKIGRESFLQRIARTLDSAGVENTVIVLGAESGRILASMGWFRGILVVNDRWEDGQLSSIVAGLDAMKLPPGGGAMICPVDHPLITKKLVTALIAAFQSSGKNIVLPVVGRRRGHPVIFSASLFDELRRAPRDVGARAVVHAHPSDVMEVPTLERGAIMDIATMSDYTGKIPGR